MTVHAIPSEFSRYFWDVDLADVDLTKHQIFVIERLLTESNHKTLQWVLNTYSQDQIRKAVTISRRLDPKTARYWQLYFNLKEDEMRCFEESSTKIDDQF